VRLKVAHHTLGVGTVLDRRRDLDGGHVAQRRGDLGGVAGLALGDAREHLVVERLHDPQQADPRRVVLELGAVGRVVGGGVQHGLLASSSLPQRCP
jgi:hypothetical protein